MDEQENQTESEKPVWPEVSIELILSILLFVVPFGAEQMNLPHNFWVGLGCWFAGIAIVLRIFWIFPIWIPKRTRLEKFLLAGILLAVFASLFYRPILTAFKNRNQQSIQRASIPQTQQGSNQNNQSNHNQSIERSSSEASFPSEKALPLAHPTSKHAKAKSTDSQTAPSSPPAPGSIVQQGNSGGVNVIQGTTGSNSPITNSPININSDRRLTSPIPATKFPQTTVWISTLGDSEEIDLAVNLQAALAAAGWNARLGSRMEVVPGTVRGIEVYGTADASQAIEELVSDLNSVGLHAQRGQRDPWYLPIEILIGGKP